MKLGLKVILLVVLGVLLAACSGGGGGAQPGGESFTIDVTGDLSWQLKPTSAADSSFMKDDTSLAPLVIHSLWFGNADHKRAFSVTFYGPDAPKAGTYNLVSGLNTDDGSVTAVLVDNTEKTEAFGIESGTITLTKVGETYSGSVDAVMKGGEIGAGDEKTVTVKGTFDGIK